MQEEPALKLPRRYGTAFLWPHSDACLSAVDAITALKSCLCSSQKDLLAVALSDASE